MEERVVDYDPIRGGFLRRHRKEVYLLSLFTIVLMVIALFPGVGYSATVTISQRGVIVGRGFTESSASLNRLFNGHLIASFNPLLYPVSYLSGSGSIFRKFQGSSDVWDHEGTQLREAVMLGTLVVEFAKNIPFLFLLSALATLVSLRLAEVPSIARFLARIQKKQLAQYTSQVG